MQLAIFGAIHKRRPQEGIEGVGQKVDKCGQGEGGLSQCGRPQKNSIMHVTLHAFINKFLLLIAYFEWVLIANVITVI